MEERRIASWRSTAGFMAEGGCSQRVLEPPMSGKRKAKGVGGGVGGGGMAGMGGTAFGDDGNDRRVGPGWGYYSTWGFWAGSGGNCKKLSISVNCAIRINRLQSVKSGRPYDPGGSTFLLSLLF